MTAYKNKTVKELCTEIFALDYDVPKCPKHKTFCEIAVSSGRGRLGKKSYGFYCNKCQDEWVVAMKKAGEGMQ